MTANAEQKKGSLRIKASNLLEKTLNHMSIWCHVNVMSITIQSQSQSIDHNHTLSIIFTINFITGLWVFNPSFNNTLSVSPSVRVRGNCNYLSTGPEHGIIYKLKIWGYLANKIHQTLTCKGLQIHLAGIGGRGGAMSVQGYVTYDFHSVLDVTIKKTWNSGL